MVRAPSPPTSNPSDGPCQKMRPLAGITGVELALAVAQAAEEGAGALLAQDVAVRLAPATDGLLDGKASAAGDAPEELVAASTSSSDWKLFGSPGLAA